MNYIIEKVFNNNVVLALDMVSDKQVVLMSKGIGYGKKKGDQVSDFGDDKKVFYILDETDKTADIKKLDYDLDKVRQVTEEIVEIARKDLGIDNDNLYDALLDHITFAIERLRIGLPIENPFIGEINLLYHKEYQVAQKAAEILSDKMDIKINEDEKGFIALHLRSAKKNSHVNAAMKSVRVYKKAVSIISLKFDREIKPQSSACKSFLLSLTRWVYSATAGEKIVMPLKHYLKTSMTRSYEVAKIVAKVIEEEMGTILSDDIICFIAVDIEKLIQM